MKKIKRIIASVMAIIMSVSLVSEMSPTFAQSVLYNDLISKDLVNFYYIIGLETPPIACSEQAKKNGVHEFILTDEGKELYNEIMSEHEKVKADISMLIGRSPEVNYDYTAAYNGFSMALSHNEVIKIKNNSGSLGIINIETGGYIDTPFSESAYAETKSTKKLSYSDLTEKILEKTGVSECGLDGEGTVIAIIDNEFDVKHEFFSMPDNSVGKLSKEDVKAVYPYLSSSPYVSERCYVNDKIPFAFDYYNYDFNPFNPYFSHGTHVAGITAGNGGTETSAVYNPEGVAPKAQLVLLGTEALYDSDIMAAYDDALYLGVDVINASYGVSLVPTGKSFSEKTAITNITATGTVFCNAVGNDAKFTDVPFNFTDYSTSGSPGNINSVFSVGSADNIVSIDEKASFVLSDGNEYAIVNAPDSPISYYFENEEMEYVYVEGIGKAEDYENVDVTDKIALVKRGTITFQEKAENALMAGAIGIIIYNNDNSEPVEMNVELLPAGMVSYQTGMKMIGTADKKLVFGQSIYTFEKSENVNMSDFSSWAFTEQLVLANDISGFGGEIVSSIADGEQLHKSYGIMSGTSMSTPQITGINALLKEYLMKNTEKYGIENRCDYSEILANLLMSTATPVYTSDVLEIASPRVQGNGIVNITDAIKTPCYISTDSEKDNYRPKISLGDGYRQSYDVIFNITNVSETDCEYIPSVQLFRDNDDENGELSVNTLRLYESEDFSISYTDDFGNEIEKIQVPAGNTIKIKVEITLSDEVFNLIKSKKGRFIDGFIRLSNMENPNLTLAFMGFCGNWSETTKGSIAYGFAYNDYDDMEERAFLTDFSTNIAGMNYADHSISQPCYSPNGDDVYDSLGLYMYFKRRCYDLTATIYNSDGKTVYTQNLGVAHNTSSLFSIIGTGYDIEWDFMENGKIKEGAEYTVEISARLPLSDKMTVIDSCTFKIDTIAPKIKKVGKIKFGESEMLIVNAEDNQQLQLGLACSDTYDEIFDVKSANCSVSGDTIIIDITYANETDVVQIYDMAGNYTSVSVSDASYVLTADMQNYAIYAINDDECFNVDNIVLKDEKNNVCDMDIQFSNTPMEIYEMYGSEPTYVSVLIDGFESAYCCAEVGIFGDSNADDIFNIRDAAYIAKMLSNKYSDEFIDFFNSIGGYCADCNKDGEITIRDAAFAANILAEKFS